MNNSVFAEGIRSIADMARVMCVAQLKSVPATESHDFSALEQLVPAKAGVVAKDVDPFRPAIVGVVRPRPRDGKRLICWRGNSPQVLRSGIDCAISDVKRLNVLTIDAAHRRVWIGVND
jgi:hypothetical protein